MTGDDLTRGTIRAALLLYAAALVAMPWLDMRRPALARAALGCWIVGWLAYLAHVALAFHHYHGWSHAAAVDHVERRSGFGPGIAFSHLFTLLWTADVLWWSLAPESHARRPRWVTLSLHGYMLFIAFNATVIYEAGAVRWAGLAATLLLAVSLALRYCPRPEPGR